MTLALRDALVALMEEKGFAPEEFHRFHPGGKLGLDLLQVHELMRPMNQVPQAPLNAGMDTILEVMNDGRLGLVILMNGGNIAGLITDGDVRRSSHLPLVAQDPATLMSPEPLSVGSMDLAAQALQLMNDRGVTALMVRDYLGSLWVSYIFMSCCAQDWLRMGVPSAISPAYLVRLRGALCVEQRDCRGNLYRYFYFAFFWGI